MRGVMRAVNISYRCGDLGKSIAVKAEYALHTDYIQNYTRCVNLQGIIKITTHCAIFYADYNLPGGGVDLTHLC